MKRFLLIGLDGAEPSLVERWMAEGELPSLAALRARGSYLPCASTMPPVTFPAWTTCVTGVNPGRHGIFDFTELMRGGTDSLPVHLPHPPNRYAIRFVNSTFRKAPALWNILSDAGRRVGILGVPATYPPEPVNGFMVAGFDSPVCTRPDASFVYPHSLFHDVRDWRFADLDESNIGPGWHEHALKALLDGIETKLSIATRLLTKEPWDFFMVVFGESDTVSHHFWLFHDPNSPRHCPGPQDAVRRVYKRLDAAVGTLIAAAGDDAVVGVVSDHGFGGAGTGVLHINNWLAEHGLLQYTSHVSGHAADLVKKTLLRWVPTSLRGRLFSSFRSMAARTESHARFAGINWAETLAWSEELNYFPSVRVNLRGREPLGKVESYHYDEFCHDLCRRLETWPPIRRAWRRNELYTGDYVDRAPDIILELNDENGYSYSCLRSRGGPAFRRIRDNERFGGKEHGMTGNHRSPGILFLSEPVNADSVRLEDIAPTVLSVLGVPGPPMDGHSLLGEPHQGVLPPGVPPNETPYSPEEESAIESRLRALGYLE